MATRISRRDPGAVVVRTLRAGDAASARALVEAETGGTPYAESFRESLERAVAGGSEEARALVAVRGRTVLGIAVFGVVAGAQGAARLHLIVVAPSVRQQGIARQLADAAASELTDRRARFVIGELADDPVLAAARTLLLSCGFREEARVPDYFRDGIALVFLRRDLTPP